MSMIYRTHPLPRLRIPAPADALERLPGEGFVLNVQRQQMPKTLFSHLMLVYACTVSKRSFIHPLIKRIEVRFLVSKLTAILTANPTISCELERTPTNKNTSI